MSEPIMNAPEFHCGICDEPISTASEILAGTCLECTRRNGEGSAKQTVDDLTTFTKNDREKPNLAILFDTPDALSEVARVMSYGAEKYSRKNWDKVDDKERYVAATLRHLMAYANGESVDPESTLPHLAHAVTSLLFLLQVEHNKQKETKNEH